jgi:hypothetical protein
VAAFSDVVGEWLYLQPSCLQIRPAIVAKQKRLGFVLLAVVASAAASAAAFVAALLALRVAALPGVAR